MREPRPHVLKFLRLCCRSLTNVILITKTRDYSSSELVVNIPTRFPSKINARLPEENLLIISTVVEK